MAPVDTLYRLGHSTLLLKLGGEFWLTDPVFAKRASPVQWLGPKRFHKPPLRAEQLPPLKGIIISHNHYDHLDEMSIKVLAKRCEHFYVPLGVGQQLRCWGVAADKYQSLTGGNRCRWAIRSWWRLRPGISRGAGCLILIGHSGVHG